MNCVGSLPSRGELGLEAGGAADRGRKAERLETGVDGNVVQIGDEVDLLARLSEIDVKPAVG